jgi:ribosomal protein L21E
MVNRIGTKQRKTRHKFKKSIREKGKISLSKYFQEFSAGDCVSLKINSNVQKGRFFPRFHGNDGKITGNMRGSCYEVKFKDQKKEKIIYVHPIHLIKQN